MRRRKNKSISLATSEPQASEVGRIASLLIGDKRPILLLGAGASVKSGIPAAGHMAQLAVRWAWCLNNARHVHDQTIVRSDWWPWLQGFNWFDEDRDFADLYPVIMKELLGVRETRREFLSHMIRPTELPVSDGYEALSNLLGEEFFTTVLTTNFDERISEARVRLSRPHALTVIRTPDDLIRFNSDPSSPQVLFLHGSVDHYSDKSLADELETLDTRFVERLMPVVRDHPIVVVGYRGAELSIMRGLFQDLVHDTNGFLRGVFWCVRGEPQLDQLHPLVQSFARTIGSNFQMVSIRGFDELLSEDLWRVVSKVPRTRRTFSTGHVPQASFDMQTTPRLCTAEINHSLLLTRLTQYADQLGISLPAKVDMNWGLEQAQERHLIIDAGGNAKATIAGWLLFAHSPQTVFSHARIDFVVHGPEKWVRTAFGEEQISARETGPADTGVERRIEGNLWSQMDTALDLLALVNQSFRLKEAQSRTAYPYDPLAIKEVVVNALVHRDYQREEPVRIEVRPQSICIVSPGGVTADVQIQAGDLALEQAIRKGRRGIKGYRNPVISDLFYGGQRMDRKGSGLADVLERSRANGGDVRFGPTEQNAFFSVELFARPEAVDAVTKTAVIAGRQQVRYTANLLAVTKLPETIYHVGYRGRTDEIGQALGFRSPPCFVADNRLFSFYDTDHVVAELPDKFPDADSEPMSLGEFLALPYGERGLVRLLNGSFEQHLLSCGLIVEESRRRAYFSKTDEGERQVTYQGRIRKATRTVVKARRRRASSEIVFWEHKTVGYQFMRFGDMWAVVLTPGYAFTVDGGWKSLGRERVNVLSTRRASRDYNATVHFDLVFWTSVLAGDEAETFELNTMSAGLAGSPIIELAARPPTVSVLEQSGEFEELSEEIDDFLDEELAELADRADEDESAARLNDADLGDRHDN